MSIVLQHLGFEVVLLEKTIMAGVSDVAGISQGAAACSEEEDTTPTTTAGGEDSDIAVTPMSAKRSRLSRLIITPYIEMTPSQWTTRVKGKNVHGGPIISVIGSNGPVHFALFTNDEPRGYFPFKMDLECQNAPSFLSGTPSSSSKVTEGLDMSLTLTKLQENFIESIESWIKSEALKNSREWFSKEYSVSEIEAMYSSSLKKDSENRYPTKIRAKVILSGDQKHLTNIAFFNKGGKLLEGAGWEFVKPLLGPDNWQRYEARGILKLVTIWIVGRNKIGARFNFSDLLVMERESETAFAAFPELEL
jgi:hypothetical protein